jgi:hypothetical protein
MALNPRRENILARLLVIMQAVVTKATRNEGTMSATSTPGMTMQDGPEAALDKDGRSTNARGNVSADFERMVMSPQIQLVAMVPSGDVGTLLNDYLLRFLLAVLTDATLKTHIGNSGWLRYTGCDLSTESGNQRSGRMDINLSIVYPFVVSELS